VTEPRSHDGVVHEITVDRAGDSVNLSNANQQDANAGEHSEAAKGSQYQETSD
jgi:hypothetical protein